MAIVKHDVKRRPKWRPLALDERIARAHKKVEQLAKEARRAQRRLARARMTYSILTGLAADQSKRALEEQA